MMSILFKESNLGHFENIAPIYETRRIPYGLRDSREVKEDNLPKIFFSFLLLRPSLKEGVKQNSANSKCKRLSKFVKL